MLVHHSISPVSHAFVHGCGIAVTMRLGSRIAAQGGQVVQLHHRSAPATVLLPLSLLRLTALSLPEVVPRVTWFPRIAAVILQPWTRVKRVPLNSAANTIRFTGVWVPVLAPQMRLLPWLRASLELVLFGDASISPIRCAFAPLRIGVVLLHLS